MSATDNLSQIETDPTNPRPTAGTISGFAPVGIENGVDLGQQSFSIVQLMEAIRKINNRLEVNIAPEELQTLLTDHLTDFNNPHRDSFSQLGFNVARDLVGSILPGSVPVSAPIYAIDPLSIIPENNLPNEYRTYTQLSGNTFIPDLNPIVTKGSDEGDNDVAIVWNDEYRNPVSLATFLSSDTSFGYKTIPTALLNIGLMGLLSQSPMTIYSILDEGDVKVTDTHSVLTGNTWDIQKGALDNKTKVFPTLEVTSNVTNTSPSEVTLLWYGLSSMAITTSKAYIIFTVPDGSKLVVGFTKGVMGYPNTVEIVYKIGAIEPVYCNEYSIGGIRYNGKSGDIIRISYTITGTSDWSKYNDYDLAWASPTHVPLPSTFLMKFIGGNPDFLISYSRETYTQYAQGMLIHEPKSNNVKTSSIQWKAPKLASIGFKGLMSISYYVDTSVTGPAPVTVFDSKCLTITLTTYSDSNNPVSQWTLKATSPDGSQSTTVGLGGYGGPIQSIAFSFDGISFRGRVSGSEGVVQIPCSIVPTDLTDASFGSFTGAILNLEMYDVPDNGYCLDFLIGDGPKPALQSR